MEEEPIISNCDIGAAVKRRRRELSWSQEMLANSLNVSYQQVQRYESGTDRISVEKLQTIAHILSVPICYFFCINPTKKSTATTCECDELASYCKKIKSRELREMLTRIARSAVEEGN